MRYATSFLLIFALVLPITATAQTSENTQLNTSDKKSTKKGGTYIKVQLAHWQEDIFNENLIEWEGNLFGSDYELTSVGVEIETYFEKDHLFLSGWSVGYRKDDLRYAEYGHMFSLKTFHVFDLKLIEVKSAIGLEWGMPAVGFDKTSFDYGPDGFVSYRHTYPAKNAPVPFVGVRRDGAWYPFGELSIQKRAGPVILETGMRVNMIMFGIDSYSIKNDHIEYNFENRRMVSPYLFAGIGLRIP